MSARDMTRASILAAILIVVYYFGSSLMYVSITNFILLLYGVYVQRKIAYLAVVIWCFLVMLMYGFGYWVIMYFILFPQYILIYNFLYRKFKSEYLLAFVGAFLTFICGTIIDLPFIITNGIVGHTLVLRLILGFETDLGSTLCTFLGVLFLLKPLKRAFRGLNN